MKLTRGEGGERQKILMDLSDGNQDSFKDTKFPLCESLPCFVLFFW